MTSPDPEQVRAAAIRTVYSTASIGGEAHDPIAISIDREIATQMPEGVAGGGGIVKATGGLELNDPVTPKTSIITRRTSPWMPVAGWPPARSADATIDLYVDDDPTQRRFTGRVAKVTGSVKDTTTVDIEDRTDDLKVDFSHYPMLRTMPPPGDRTSGNINVGLRADWIADKIFRRAGFNTTPPVMGQGILSVPAQGSMWPQVGTCISCTEADGTDGLPSWYRSGWGWAVADVAASYSPPTALSATLRGGVIAQGLHVTESSNGVVRMDTNIGASAVLSTRVLANRQIELRYNGNVLYTMTPGATGWTKVETLWRSDGTLRVHANNGWERVETWSPGGGVLDGAIGNTDISVQPTGRAGGFMVQRTPMSYTGGYVSSTPNARIVTGDLLAAMRAMPSLTSRDGLNLLQEISESLAISMWIDETGDLWWVHPDRMRDQAPVATLTATYDLLDLSWEDNANIARRSVTVTYMDPTIRRRNKHKLLAWEGAGDNLDQGESTEEIITPPADQDWIEVDSLGQAIYATPFPSNPDSLPDFNRGIGSWVGGTHLDANGDSPQTKLADWDSTDGPRPPWVDNHNDDYPNLQRSFTRIGPAAWKLSVGLQDLASNYWPEIQQKLDPVHDHQSGVAGVGSDINMSWTGQNMPIIRCKAITDWADAEYTSSITGPAMYEEFVHDTGPWAGEGVPAFADWLAEQVTKPQPILRDYPVAYRSDIKLGNVIDVVEDVVYKVRLRVLIIGLSESHSEGDSELKLTGRVISATALSWTYDQLAALGLTYDELQALGDTYEELSIPPANLSAVIGEGAAPAPFEAGILPPTIELPDAESDAREEGGDWTGRWVWPAPSEVPAVNVGLDVVTPEITLPDDGGTA